MSTISNPLSEIFDPNYLFSLMKHVFLKFLNAHDLCDIH